MGLPLTQEIRTGRTMGDFVPYGEAAIAEAEAPPARSLTTLVREERCVECPWPETCAADRTCWEEESAAGERDQGLELLKRMAAGEAAREPDRSPWTQERIIAAVRAHVLEHGEPPRANDWRAADPDGLRPTQNTVAHYFGSWNDAITAAGERPRQRGGPRRWTKDTTIAALQAWADEHGTPPKSVEWQRVGDDHPNVVMVAKLFGSWSNGVEAAGFERPRQGQQRLTAGARAIAQELEPGEAIHDDAPSEPQVRQEPPRVWAVKVPDTGLRYRTPDEAFVAAEQIEYDGEQVADRARNVGDDDRAEKAWDAAHELAEKVRVAARVASGEPEPEVEKNSPNEQAAKSTSSAFAVRTELRFAGLSLIGAARDFLDALEAELTGVTDASSTTPPTCGPTTRRLSRPGGNAS
jgi:hypothetical protein